jgi:hypothetical protein
LQENQQDARLLGGSLDYSPLAKALYTQQQRELLDEVSEGSESISFKDSLIDKDLSLGESKEALNTRRRPSSTLVHT